jgi:hypothetical protein
MFLVTATTVARGILTLECFLDIPTDSDGRLPMTDGQNFVGIRRT